MSIRCKYLTCEKLDLEQFKCVGYACDDMSVEREKDKTYSVTEYIDKDDPRFGYIRTKARIYSKFKNTEFNPKHSIKSNVTSLWTL